MVLPSFAHSLALLLIAAALPAQSLIRNVPVDSLALPTLTGGQAFFAGGDIDGDGDDDISMIDGSLYLLRKQGSAFVQSTILAPTAFNSFCQTHIADFDGDQIADLLVGPVGGGALPSTLRIWWGNGNGQFPTPNPTDVPLPSSFARGELAVADVDLDGDLDCVLATEPIFLLHSAIMLRNLGARQFQEAPASQFPLLGSGACTPHFVDLDADGYPELLLVSRTARTRLYWNNGGNFAEALTSQFPLVSTSQRGMAVADFDGDADLDLVLGGHDASGRLLLRTGVRQFVAASGAPPTADRVVALQPADTDGDGDVDLVAFRRDLGNVYLNNGSGSFPARTSFGSCDDTASVTVVDMDADGDKDFLRFGVAPATSAGGRAHLAVSYTVRPGIYEHAGDSRLPVGANLVSVTGDIDGDGWKDLAVAVASPNTTMQFARSDGRGVFGYDVYAPRTGPTNVGVFLDLDGDGRDEFFVSGPSPYYYANVGGQLAVTPTPFASIPVFQPKLADVDGDGDNDLLCASTTTRIFLRTNGAFVDQSAALLPPGVTGAPMPGDFDRDGDIDIWLHDLSQDRVLRNGGGGVFTVVVGAVPSSAVGGDRASVGDIDNDGDLDLQAGRHILRNIGNCMFVDASSVVPNIVEANQLSAMVDIDDDGDLDLVSSGVVLFNNGNGTLFTLATNVLSFPSTNGGSAFDYYDYDRDGDVDLTYYGVSPQLPSVHTNMLRHAWIVQPSRLGGGIEFHYSTTHGQIGWPTAVWPVASFGTVPPTYVQNMGWLQVDPAQAVILPPHFLFAIGAEIVHNEPVPNNAALLGVHVYVQPVEIRGGRLRFGGLCDTYLGR